MNSLALEGMLSAAPVPLGVAVLASRHLSGLSSSSATIMAVIMSYLLESADAVCIHCKDTIAGCTGGENCPAFTAWTSNTAIFKDKAIGDTPKMAYSLTPELATHFTRPVVDAIVGLACGPAMGQEVDFSSASYRKSSQVVQAAMYGHCSAAEAMSVLSQRLEDATDATAVAKIKGAMDALSLQSEAIVSSATGYLTFIWTKISMVIGKRSSGVVRIELNSEKAKVRSLTATLARPSSAYGFYDMLHYFIMVITGLGISSYFIVAKFVDNVAYTPIRMGESWHRWPLS
jgi:hypothetical protein